MSGIVNITNANFDIIELIIDVYLSSCKKDGIESNVTYDLKSISQQIQNDTFQLSHEEIESLIEASSAFRDTVKKALTKHPKNGSSYNQLSKDLKRTYSLLSKLRSAL